MTQGITQAMIQNVSFDVSLAGMSRSEVMTATLRADAEHVKDNGKTHPGIMMALGFGGFLTLLWSAFIAWQCFKLTGFLVHSFF
jgi:hypothetical protein